MNQKQKAFLAAFRETGNVRLACKAAKVSRSRHYQWRKEDVEYHEAFDLAKEEAADVLEAEAYRRAVEGVEKQAGWYKGVAGGIVREYSDNLLMFLLKGIRPEKYRERQEVAVSGGILSTIDFAQLPDEMIERISNGEHPLAVLASAAEEIKERLALPSGSE